MKIFVTFPQRNRGVAGAISPDWVKLVILPDNISPTEIIKTLNTLFWDWMFWGPCRSAYYPYAIREDYKKYYPLWIL